MAWEVSSRSRVSLRTATWAQSTFLAAPAEPRSIADAPVTRDDIRRFDSGLPAIVDAWIASGEGVPSS